MKKRRDNVGPKNASNANTQVTITVPSETLIAALQETFRSADIDHSVEIIVALQIVANLLAYDGTTKNETIAEGILADMAWLAEWMADELPGLSEETLARIEQIRASSPDYLLDEEEDDQAS
jgi:hypothetical protein